MLETKKSIEFRVLNIGDVEPNPWNPNQMSDKAFQRLKKEIVDTGFLEPIQVVPVEGRYRILGGEHRWRAMQELGNTEIPAMVILKEEYQGEAGEDACKFLTMRLNCIKGKVNSNKFQSYYQSLAIKHDQQFMQELMGVVDDAMWHQMLTDAKVSLKGALDGIPDEDKKKSLMNEFDKEAKVAKTAEDIGNIVSKLMDKATNTLESGYLVFSYGGQKHIFIEIKGKKRFQYLHDRLAAYKEQGLEAGDVIYDLMVGYIPGEGIQQLSNDDEIDPT